MGITTLQLHKRASYEFRFIQDKYCYSPGHRCYAIADGTTQSFYSERWAELITRRFVQHPTFDIKELIASFSKAAEEFRQLQFPFSPNPALASLEKAKQKKGATATFTGIQFGADGLLSIITCGDSNVFIIRKGELQGFPFNSVEELDQNTTFLNTEKILSGEVEDTFFSRSKVRVEKDDIIILATDALSRFLLNQKDRYKELFAIKSFEALHSFCTQSWADRTLEEDDITAVLINDLAAVPLEILPPDDFSFPKEEEKEFVPSFPSSDNYDSTDQEMQYLNNSIQQLNNEVHQLKKKSKTQEMLLIIAVGLILVNLFFVFTKNEQPEEGLSKEWHLKQRIDEQAKEIVEKDRKIEKLEKQLVNSQPHSGRKVANDAENVVVTNTQDNATEAAPITQTSGRKTGKTTTVPKVVEKPVIHKEEPAKPEE